MNIPEQGSMVKHIIEAEKLSFPEKPRRLGQTPSFRAAVDMTCGSVESHQEWRKKNLEFWLERARFHKEKDSQCGREDEKFVKINVPVVEEMLTAHSMAGERFLRHLSCGFPLVGISDEPGCWQRQQRTRPVCSREDLLANSEQVLEAARAAARSEAEPQAVWDSFLRDVEAGHLEGPFDLEEDRDLLPQKFLALRRFSVEQWRPKNGELVRKLRMVENSKKAGLNRAYTNRTKMVLPDIDDVPIFRRRNFLSQKNG